MKQNDKTKFSRVRNKTVRPGQRSSEQRLNIPMTPEETILVLDRHLKYLRGIWTRLGKKGTCALEIKKDYLEIEQIMQTLVGFKFMNGAEIKENALKATDLCTYPGCKKNSSFQLGIAYYNKRKAEKIIGFVCLDHMRTAIENVMDQCAGTTLWAVVCDKKGKVLFHSYEADQSGFKAAMGWELFYEEFKQSHID